MSRVVGPAEGERTVQTYDRGKQRFTGFPGRHVTLYTDEDRTELADVRAYDPANPTVVGSALAGSRVTLDSDSRLPQFWMPDGVTRLYGRVLRGPDIVIGADTRSTLGVGPAVARTGVRVPASWGQFWFPKLAAAKAGTGVARVGFIGTSNTQGYFASHLRTTSFVGRVATALQEYAGDGGSGYEGMQRSDVFISGLGGSGYAHYQGNGSAWPFTGTWSTPTWGLGPSLGGLKGSTGATVTIPFRGTALDIWWFNEHSVSAWTYAIDGGAPVTVTPGAGQGTGDLAVTTTTATGLSAGAHTVTITSGAGGVRLAGITGRNAAGVRVDNYGIAGMQSGGWGNGDPFNSGTYMGGWRNPCDLLVVEAAVNDIIKAVQTYNNVNTTSGSATITSASLRQADNGRRISGAGIPYGTTIVAINELGGSATLSQNATATASNVTCTITDPDPVGRWVANTQQHLLGVLDNFYGGGSTPDGKVDLVFLVPMFPGNTPNDPLGVAKRLQGEAYALAEAYGAAVIDINAMYGNSWSRWNVDGNAGNAANPAVNGGDTVHASDAGHLFTANRILDLVRRAG